MPSYTPYKTLDEVKEAIDKFDECCLDLLDVLDKLKPAGIDPKSLNPLASEIHRSLQRIAPQARARIELTKERKKDLRCVYMACHSRCGSWLIAISVILFLHPT